jgi:hypothetical protein
LLGEPEAALKLVTCFAGLPASDETIRKVAVLVRKERAYAYREKPELRAFADHVPERLATYGY